MNFWKRTKPYGWLLGLMTGLLFLGIGACQGQFSVILKKGSHDLPGMVSESDNSDTRKFLH